MMKERDLYPNEMYKKYCKELGGYVNVLYEENKLLLDEVELDEGNKFRLLYFCLLYTSPSPRD